MSRVVTAKTRHPEAGILAPLTAPKKFLALAAVALLGAIRPADAAVEASPQQEPLQCWWRASAGAVRIAQPFTVLLTCSIVEANQQHVVVDQAKLSPQAISVSPFEVLGGSLAESRSGEQWFFQRLYQVRIITDTFGEDVQIPPVVVTYQLETEAPAGGRARGIERRHELPALPMRVVSLVPAHADDIREAPIDTFEEIDDAAFGAFLYGAIGLTFMGVGAVGLIVALATGFRARHANDAGTGSLEDRLVLRHVGRELDDIRATRIREGWTPDLVGRALASTRIVGSYVTRRPLSLRTVEPNDYVPEGVLVHRDKRGRRTLIASSLTASALRRRKDELQDEDMHRTAIQDALGALTRAHYGRGEPPEPERLDAGIDSALAAVAAVKHEHAWTTRARSVAVARLRAIRIPWFR